MLFRVVDVLAQNTGFRRQGRTVLLNSCNLVIYRRSIGVVQQQFGRNVVGRLCLRSTFRR